MLRLNPGIYADILTHCLADHPVEACGVVAGRGGVAVRAVPLCNAENSSDYYRFDPDEQLAVWSRLEEQGEQVLGIYHSHTSTPPHPSRTDVLYAGELEAHYVIVSTRQRERPEMLSFVLDGAELVQEQVVIA